jgi:hypothetical protein
MTLDQIALLYGTDKATAHPLIKGHCYTPHYEKFFEPFRSRVINILEIGIGSGESIQTWLHYFRHGHVFGVDIVHDTNQFNSLNSEDGPSRYIFETGDQGNPEFWKGFTERNGAMDIIVDDGSHRDLDIISSFASLWPTMKPGALYCIEDLAVAYGGAPYTNPPCQNHMDFIKDKLDDINRKDEIDFMYFSKELAIIGKK